jgi:ferredoxin-fold anticodon binding domain-containing protein
MARLKSNFIGLGTLADVVHKRKVLKKINGRMHVCAWPKTDKDRVLSLNEMCNREKFKKTSQMASIVIQDPVLKSIYSDQARRWQSAFNVAFIQVYDAAVQRR